MKKRIANLVAGNSCLFGAASALKFVNFRKFNKLHCFRSARKNEVKATCLPCRGVLNLTDMCNYRCAFCEIHYFHDKFPELHKNFIDIEVVKKYEDWIKNLDSLAFYGSVGEPMMNKQFAHIARYLKTRYPSLQLSVTTNGYFLNQETADILIDCGFDHVLVSLHAAKGETYKRLLGGNLDRILKNILYYTKHKKPQQEVAVNFMLNRINAQDIYSVVDLILDLQCDYLVVNNYYDVRNKLEREISYYFSPEEGNHILDNLYSYARKQGLRLMPLAPPYYYELKDYSDLDYDDLTVSQGVCPEPWRSVQFKGTLEHADSHYISVCNRIELMRLNYKEFFADGTKTFSDIWNHPILQFLRETVNSENMNLICRLCKSQEYKVIRCLDNDRYRILRDHAVNEFYRNFKKHCAGAYQPVKGLYLLDEIPFS